MTQIIERFFQSQQEMYQSLLANTQYQLEKAVQQQGEATFLVSGGTTPKPLYCSLSKTKLPWQRIKVAMVDERWVNPDNEASNERLIRINLLKNLARDARLTTMKIDGQSPVEACATIENCYKKLNTPFDLTILGMGNDGHTASLFPNSIGLETGLNSESTLCCPIDAVNSAAAGKYQQRLSLTINAIKRSRQIKLLITGDKKLKTYQKAKRAGSTMEMPVRAILQLKDIPINIYWAP
ncbi:6-phosphogluconolactonase [Aliikangiella sp. G2MR2-5]|uniref:6-phosphogluconolactonase n=1 Tax=Aliikangiella sp. G2MR2-5 TaxID=2788943 RepID=UPI0018ABA2E8|nr:6-phosphogluconolactonase [Aliikangiella sp. G2MR2-5]